MLDLIQPGVPTDWSKDVFPKLLEAGRPLYGYVAGGYWCDVGNIGEYMRTNGDVLNHRVQVEELGQHIGGNIWCGTAWRSRPMPSFTARSTWATRSRSRAG